MKTAIIIERANISLGGAERSIFELSQQLSMMGVEVDLLAAKGASRAKNIHVLCSQKHGKRTSLVDFAAALKSHLVENHYDIIHSTLPFRFADIYQPRGGSCRETAIRHAASYDNAAMRTYKLLTSYMNMRRTVLIMAERRLCRDEQGPVVAALSNYVKEQFENHYGLSSDRIAVIRNGIKLNRTVNVKDADKLRGQILAKLKINESVEPVFLLFVANNFRLKGLGAVIRALKVATRQETKRPVYLVVAGNGKCGKYRRLATSLRIRKRVVFLGHIRHIQDALSITDVGILASFYDAASRFVLEALAAQKPVITTRFNGAADLFTDGRHGSIVDSPNDISAMADAIMQYADSENIQKASTAIAEDNLRENISIARHCTELVNLYETILKKKG